MRWLYTQLRGTRRIYATSPALRRIEFCPTDPKTGCEATTALLSICANSGNCEIPIECKWWKRGEIANGQWANGRESALCFRWRRSCGPPQPAVLVLVLVSCNCCAQMSSSAAAVIMPEPSEFNSNRIRRAEANVGTQKSGCKLLPANLLTQHNSGARP